MECISHLFKTDEIMCFSTQSMLNNGLRNTQRTKAIMCMEVVIKQIKIIGQASPPLLKYKSLTEPSHCGSQIMFYGLIHNATLGDC